MNTKEILTAAKAMALADTNKHRAKAHLPPLTRVSNLWWKLHGKTYIDKALKQKRP